MQVSFRGCAIWILSLVGPFSLTAQFNSFADLGSASVNGAAISKTVDFVFAGLTTPPTLSLRYGFDFILGANTCSSANEAIACSAVVNAALLSNFKPRFPGSSQDAVVAKDASGTVIAGTYLSGVGLGPQAAFSPGFAAPLILRTNAYFAHRTTASSFMVSPEGDGYRVMKLDSSGVLTRYAGTGVYGETGDGGPAVNAQLDSVSGLRLDAAGNLFITFRSAIRGTVRKITAATGIISSVFQAPTGPGYSGVTMDAAGNLYLSSSSSNSLSGQIWRVDAATGLGVPMIGGFERITSSSDSVIIDTGSVSSVQVGRRGHAS